MNILSLKFFNLLKLRTSKIKTILTAQEAAKSKDTAKDWDGVDLTKYTIVDHTPGGRKCDLLTSVHMGSRQLDSARSYHKLGKARWHQNANEQQYKPRQVQLDKQLEFIWDELGLSDSMEQTTIGTQNP